jgi:hypothetical protein
MFKITFSDIHSYGSVNLCERTLGSTSLESKQSSSVEQSSISESSVTTVLSISVVNMSVNKINYMQGEVFFLCYIFDQANSVL